MFIFLKNDKLRDQNLKILKNFIICREHFFNAEIFWIFSLGYNFEKCFLSSFNTINYLKMKIQNSAPKTSLFDRISFIKNEILLKFFARVKLWKKKSF